MSHIVGFTFRTFFARIAHNLKMSVEFVGDPYNLKTLIPRMEDLGYQFHYTPETPTTMILAEKYVRTGNDEPAVFLADHQTQGRGREGRVWLDKPGASLLTTAVLGIKDNTISIFADMVALHVVSILRSVPLIDNVCIKYPNDLVIDDKKVGGLLVTNIYDESRIYLGTSVGIGVNIHYTQEELANYPTDYGATALDLHTPKLNSRQLILWSFLENLRFLSIDAEVFGTNLQMQQDLNNLWRAHSSILGRKVQVETDNEVVVQGAVVDTQIGRGISLGGKTQWFNQFNTKMKVRVLD